MEDVRLRLYVFGDTKNSIVAIRNISYICETYLKGIDSLDIVDIKSSPELAEVENVMVTPTLIRMSPGPQIRLVGNLTDINRVLEALEIRSYENVLHMSPQVLDTSRSYVQNLQNPMSSSNTQFN